MYMYTHNIAAIINEDDIELINTPRSYGYKVHYIAATLLFIL